VFHIGHPPDYYVTRVHLARNDSRQPAPVRRNVRAWRLRLLTKCFGTKKMEKHNRTSGLQAIRLSDNPALIVGPKDSLTWILKILVFTNGAKSETPSRAEAPHVNSEPSTHSKEDTMVFIVYSWSLD
jgi:hypothetical protein